MTPSPAPLRRSSACAALRDVLGARRLPTFPSQHQRILDTLRHHSDRTGPIVEAISMDPSVSVRVLRMANSAAFGLCTPVESIQRAVVLLGHRRLEAIVMGLGVARAVPRHRVGKLDRSRFWSAATRRAAIARRLSEAALPPSAALTFTAALISDVAVPLLSGTRPRLYKDLLQMVRREGVALETLERETFGWDHAEVAGWLAAEWMLPPALAQLMSTHHAPIGQPVTDVEQPIAGIVRTAVLATATLGTEPNAPGRSRQASAAAWHHLGVAPETTRRILDEKADPTDPLTRIFS